MSRPVYEPSLTRADAAQAWASRQLFRRPSPRAGFIPYMRMWQYDVVTSMDGTTPGDAVQLTFDRWDYSDSSKIEPISILGTTPPTILYMETHQRGLYAISCSLDFDQTIGVAPEGVGIAIVERVGSTYSPPPTAVMPGQPLGGLNTEGKYSFTFIRSYPPIWVVETTDLLSPALPTFGMSVSVISGDATTDTFSAMMEVHLLQEYDYELVPDTGGDQSGGS